MGYIGYNLKRAFRTRRKGLSSIILFVTSKCTERCPGCLYRDKLNKKEKDLSLEEIENISRSLGEVWHLQLSGGEPFLRDDLNDICRVFRKKNATKMISIPTNAFDPVKIHATVLDILKGDIEHLAIPISVDITEKNERMYHGKSGRFKQANRLLELFQDLKGNPRFSFNISTKVSNHNLEDIPYLIEYYRKRGIVHVVYPIRGVELLSDVRPPSSEEYRKLMDIPRIDRHPWLSKRMIRGITAKALDGEGWSFPCVAGGYIGVIDSDGEVRLCELLPSVGNLRDYGYDFNRIWTGINARAQRKEITKGRCSVSCTHGCFLGPSILNSPLKALRMSLR